jgi:hypothetical protein
LGNFLEKECYPGPEIRESAGTGKNLSGNQNDGNMVVQEPFLLYLILVYFPSHKSGIRQPRKEGDHL